MHSAHLAGNSCSRGECCVLGIFSIIASRNNEQPAFFPCHWYFLTCWQADFAGVPSQLVISAYTFSASTGGTYNINNFIVEVRASSGEVIPTYTSAVFVILLQSDAATGSCLTGTPSINASAGVAVFNLKICQAGSDYSLQVASGNLVVTTTRFNVP